MFIEAFFLRGFRSLESVNIPKCARLNVFIGRNNSGKSSALSAIEIALTHLKSGHVAFRWNPSGRLADQFTNRKTTTPIEIGVQFELPPEINYQLRTDLKAEAVGLEIPINNLAEEKSLSIVISIFVADSGPIIFIKSAYVGTIDFQDATALTSVGTRLFEMDGGAARALSEIEISAARVQSEAEDVDLYVSEGLPGADAAFREAREAPGRYLSRYLPSIRGRLPTRHIEETAASATNVAEFRQALARKRLELEASAEAIHDTPVTEGMQAFSGSIRKPPQYLQGLIERLSQPTLLHFLETREAIGAEEAQQLLQLKTRRGGTERLNTLQRTIRSLLGVTVDAFEPEEASEARRRVRAEMDIDDFVIEANGSGIREALRIILDIELKKPALALIEEPEVHLHPGLEKVMHGYLVDKSASTQIFLATHSTSFLDASTRQNIYILSREKSASTRAEIVSSESDAVKIATEVGLRPSSVLMFDRLLFVEGPTDEAVFRELARKLNLDFAAENVGIIQMGGVAKFAHYAADATIDLLSRRQIKMWFVIDKDEKDDAELKKIVERLGARAKLLPLKKRELENYLLVPRALSAIIAEKKMAPEIVPTPAQLGSEIVAAANSLKDRVIALNLSKMLCRPQFVDRQEGTIEEKLRASLKGLEERLASLPAATAKAQKETERAWAESRSIAPGSEILQKVFAEHGLTYNKSADGVRIAGAIQANEIDGDLKEILESVTKAD